MSRRISVRDARDRFGARPAIITERETVTFEALARRVERAAVALAREDLPDRTGAVSGAGRRTEGVGDAFPRPVSAPPVSAPPVFARPIVAPPRLDVLVEVLAHVEQSVPVALVHPRLTAAERAAVADVVRGVAVPADGLAVFFTSGTTGTPKGALLSHRAFVAAAEQAAAALALRPADRWLLAMPLAHVGGFSIVTRSLVCGCAVVLPEQVERFDEAAVIAAIEGHGVTIASLVPTMLHRLLHREPRWDPPAHLRAIVLGGAGAPPPLLDAARARGWPVLTTYGLTESCAMVTLQPLGTAPDRALGAGLPLAGNEVRVRPSDAPSSAAGAPVGAVSGEREGELEVRGPALMDGYVGLPREVAFTADGWLRTGDLARLDAAGRVHILARRTDLIVTGGENVYPAEVEAVLTAHPRVAQAAVVGFADAEWGERVVAAVVLHAPPARPGARLEQPSSSGPAEVDELASEIVEHTRGSLAPHKRPRQVVVLATLPVGASGKIDRRAVKALVAAALGAP